MSDRANSTGLGVGFAAASAALLRVAWPAGLLWHQLPTALAHLAPEQSLPLVLALSLCALSLWLGVTVAVCALGRLPGALGRTASTAIGYVAPAALRRVAEVLLGTSTVLATTIGMAHAAPAPHAAQPALDRPAVAAPALTLDRPAMEHPRRAAPAVHTPTRTVAPQPKSVHHEVTVRPGDSLWRIAARALPEGSSPEVIEHAWHRWYRANRTVIGPDPGLLQPGQQLTPPTP